MRLRPTEVKAVTALLEHEASSVEELAKAVIKTIDEMRESRDHYVVRINLGEDFAVGPFPTRNAAEAAARTMHPEAEPGRITGAVQRLVPVTFMQGESVEPKLGQYCETCGHPNLTHNWPKARVAGCIVGYRAGKPESGCQCGRPGGVSSEGSGSLPGPVE